MKNVTTSAPRLHPCPYCGAPVHVSVLWGTFAVTCDEYCIESIKNDTIFADENDCIRDWQSRFGEEV